MWWVSRFYIYKSSTSNVLCYSEFHAKCNHQATKEDSLRLSFKWHPAMIMRKILYSGMQLRSLKLTISKLKSRWFFFKMIDWRIGEMFQSSIPHPKLVSIVFFHKQNTKIIYPYQILNYWIANYLELSFIYYHEHRYKFLCSRWTTSISFQR